MKRLLTILLLLSGLFASAQTQPTLPAGSQIFSSNLFLSPDSSVWTGKAGQYINLGSWKKVMEAMPDTWTPTQIDSAIMSNISTLSSKASNFIITSNTTLDWQSDLAFDEMGNSTSETWAQRYGNSINILRLYNDGGTWRDQSSQVSVLFSGQDIQTVTFGSVIGQNRITITGKGSGAPIGIFTNRGDWVAGTYSRGDYVTAPARGDPSAVSLYFLIGTEEYNSTTSPTADTANWSEVPAAGGFQALSQPSIGQIAISDGNTINLNTVNTSGNQTGIAGNKEWTGLQTFSSVNNYFESQGSTSQHLNFRSDGQTDWTIQKNGNNKNLQFIRFNGGVSQGSALVLNNESGLVAISNLSGTGNGIVGVSAAGTLTRRPESDVIQTLSLGTSSGNIAISGGNSVSLSSLTRTNVTTDISNLESWPLGFHPYVYTTGSSGFSSTAGGGFMNKRTAGTFQGSFFIDKTNSNDGVLRYAVGSTSGLGAWEIFASRKWVADQGFKTNIVGSDLNITATGTRVPAWNEALGVWAGNGYQVSTNQNNSMLVLRTATGQGRFSDAIEANEAVTLGQANSLYAGLASTNSFTGLNVFQRDNNAAILQRATSGFGLYMQLRDVDNSTIGYFGVGSSANNNLGFYSNIANRGFNIMTTGEYRFSGLTGVGKRVAQLSSSGDLSGINVGTSAGNIVEVQSNGKIDPTLIAYTIPAILTANKTLAAADKNAYIRVTGTITITMPAGLSTTDYPIGSTTNVRISTGATVNFVGESGVTLDHPDGAGNVSVEGRKVVSIVRVGANAYDLIY